MIYAENSHVWFNLHKAEYIRRIVKYDVVDSFWSYMLTLRQ